MVSGGATGLVHPSRRSRFLSFGSIGAAHLALFALLLMPSRAPTQLRSPTLSVFDVSGPPLPRSAPPRLAQPKVVPPTPPEPIVVPPAEVPLPTPSATIVAMIEQSEASSQGGACDLTAPVQAALQSSEAVRATLPRIPRDQRSVANAIMVWKAAWVPEDQQLDAVAIASIRDVVAGTIAAASAECRLQPQTGPRLLLVPDADDTVVLAVGSGQWRWQDLVDTARPPSADDYQPVALNQAPSTNHSAG